MRLGDLIRPWRNNYVAFCYDFILINLSFYLALVFRFDNLVIESIPFDSLIKSMLTLGITQFAVLYTTGLYKGLWRYSSTHDLFRIIKCASFAVIASIFTLFFITRLENFPRSVFILDWILLLFSWRSPIFI